MSNYRNFIKRYAKDNPGPNLFKRASIAWHNDQRYHLRGGAEDNLSDKLPLALGYFDSLSELGQVVDKYNEELYGNLSKLYHDLQMYKNIQRANRKKIVNVYQMMLEVTNLKNEYVDTIKEIGDHQMIGSGMRGSGMRGNGMRGSGMRGSGMRGNGMRGNGMRGNGMRGSQIRNRVKNTKRHRMKINRGRMRGGQRHYDLDRILNSLKMDENAGFKIRFIDNVNRIIANAESDDPIGYNTRLQGLRRKIIPMIKQIQARVISNINLERNVESEIIDLVTKYSEIESELNTKSIKNEGQRMLKTIQE